MPADTRRVSTATVPQTDSGREATDVEATDWYRAVTLPERIASLDPTTPPDVAPTDDRVRRRCEAWNCRYPQLHERCVSAFLSALGTGTDAFLHILHEPIGSVRDRLAATPPWLEAIRLAFADREGSDAISFEDLAHGHDTVLMLSLIEPLIRQAADRLRSGLVSLQHEMAATIAIDARIEGALLTNVARRLLEMLIPTLALELNVARVRNSLRGATQRQRFAHFITLLRQPDFSLALLREYPVLARQVVICLDQWVTCSLEFLRRLATDWHDLRACFWAGGDPGRLTSVDDTQGDQHQAGRSVLILTFSTGFRLVYKPRPLAAAAHFQDFLTWLNDRGADPPLRTIRILDRGAYRLA